MTLHARSDLMSVAVSKDHGGCGATHMRSVTHGAPEKVWVLDCPACEDHLRSDPLWAVDALEIPETPDEQRAREKAEEKGEHGQKIALENAVTSLAATAEGFNKLMAMMFMSNPQMAENMNKMLAAMGDTNQATVQDAGNEASINEQRAALGLEPFAFDDANVPIKDLVPPDFTRMNLVQLKDLCRQRGLPISGTRAELVERLRG